MELSDYSTTALYAELMRRGEAWRSEWALHVVALERAMRLLCRHNPEDATTIYRMVGGGLHPDLVREASRIAGIEHAEYL